MLSFKPPGRFTSYMDSSPLHYSKVSGFLWWNEPESLHLMVTMVKSLFTVIMTNVFKVLCVSIYLALVSVLLLYWTSTCLSLTASSLFRLLSSGVHADPRPLSGVVGPGVLDWEPGDIQGDLEKSARHSGNNMWQNYCRRLVGGNTVLRPFLSLRSRLYLCTRVLVIHHQSEPKYCSNSKYA